MKRVLAIVGVVLFATASAAAAARADGLVTYGDVARFAIPSVAGIISLGKGDNEGAVQLLATYVTAQGTTHGLKRAVDKTRPNGGRYSFPSGHTTGAMAGASYLHYRYGWQYGFPAYAAVGLVAYSRVKGGYHRWEDVVAGAAIGNAWAYLLTDTLNDNVVVIPVFDMGKKNFGILAGVRF